MRLRSWLPLVLPLVIAVVAGCDRPVEVKVDPAGAQRLALAGDRAVVGTVTRTLTRQGRTLPKGTRVRIDETWLMRKDGKEPAGYRISGLYDPTQRSDGLALARNAVDAYYVAYPLDEAAGLIPVPAAYFKPAP